MTDILNTPVPRAAAEPPSDFPVTPTVTFHQAEAAKVRAALAEVRKMVTDLQMIHPEVAKSLNGLMSVPTEFILTTCNVVEIEPRLQGTLDVSAVRDDMQYVAAYQTLVDDIYAFFRDMRLTCGSRHARAAEVALKSYRLAQTYNRDTSAEFVTHVELMSRDLGRKRVKSRVKEVPPPQQPHTSH